MPTGRLAARAARLCAAAFMVGTAAVTAQEPVERLTLEEALVRALAVSPQVAQAEASVGAAAWGERRAGAAFLPSLSIGSSVGLSGSGTLPGGVEATTRESYGAGVSASLDLFTGGRRGAERDRAQAESFAAEALLTERRYASILTTQRAFFEAARAADLVAVAQARVESASQALEAAERRMNVGSATSSDVLRAQLEMSRARQSLLEAENQARTATLVLGRHVGAPHAVGVSLTDADRSVRPIALAEAELVGSVLSAAPAVAAADAAVRSAGAATRVAASQYLPRVSLSTGYDWLTQQRAWAGINSGWSVRVGLSLPVFDNFQREAGVADARNRASVAELQLADARRAAQVEAERLIGALRVAEERITLAEEGVRVAEEDLRVQETRYQVAASTMLDRLVSQTALAEARQNLVGARYDYQIVRAELEALAGRPL
jgi:outer membrane protein